jgi:ATP-dependent DNA helicase DinG
LNNDYIKNFPFPARRESQSHVLNEIANGFTSGYKYVLLEAPTGFGKSPVAIAVALTLGTSYICTSTKDLQTQYAKDFPYLKVAKGKNNFVCAVKEDFMRNGTYKCGLCYVSNEVKKCYHRSAAYGPCMSNESFKKRGCKYRTFLEDYKVNNKGTREEEVFIDQDTTDDYQQEYSQWIHLNLNEKREWRPCEYYDQFNIALISSHSILNYPIFLALQYNTPNKRIFLPTRDVLILDEAHRLEEEIVKFTGISISKRRWTRYIPDFEMVDYGYDDIEKWIDFLIDLWKRMIDLRGKLGEELAIEAMRDIEKLTEVIDNIHSNPKNWIVSEIKKQGYEVIGVELKPLDVSAYCQRVFEQYDKILMMSATILDKDAFCTSLGLAPGEVKFIQVPSDFPLENRPIHPLNTAYLNSKCLQLQEVQIKIARATDKLMTIHSNEKGIIHTTSYKQLYHLT